MGSHSLLFLKVLYKILKVGVFLMIIFLLSFIVIYHIFKPGPKQRLIYSWINKNQMLL